jgi:hypothetical protein
MPRASESEIFRAATSAKKTTERAMRGRVRASPTTRCKNRRHRNRLPSVDSYATSTLTGFDRLASNASGGCIGGERGAAVAGTREPRRYSRVGREYFFCWMLTQHQSESGHQRCGCYPNALVCPRTSLGG